MGFPHMEIWISFLFVKFFQKIKFFSFAGFKIIFSYTDKNLTYGDMAPPPRLGHFVFSKAEASINLRSSCLDKLIVKLFSL